MVEEVDEAVKRLSSCVWGLCLGLGLMTDGDTDSLGRALGSETIFATGAGDIGIR